MQPTLWSSDVYNNTKSCYKEKQAQSMPLVVCQNQSTCNITLELHVYLENNHT